MYRYKGCHQHNMLLMTQMQLVYVGYVIYRALVNNIISPRACMREDKVIGLSLIVTTKSPNLNI